MLGGEGHVGEHAMFCAVHAGAKLRPFGAELVAGVAPGLRGAA